MDGIPKHHITEMPKQLQKKFYIRATIRLAPGAGGLL